MLFALNHTCMLPGYASFGWVADKLGRRNSFVLYTLLAACLVPLYAHASDPKCCLLWARRGRFSGTGFFSAWGLAAGEFFLPRGRAGPWGFPTTAAAPSA